MNKILKYKMVWLVRVLFIFANFFVFQNSIIPISATPIIFNHDHHTGISETYTYDKIESSTNVEVGHTGGLSRVLLGKGIRPNHEVLAGVVSVAAKTGTTVLGHYPAYTKLAAELGAKRFNIPTNVWNKMTPAQQWAANQKFLDRMILRGDNIRLATPLNQVKPGSFYQRELNYLIDKGYKVSSDGLWLVK